MMSVLLFAHKMMLARLQTSQKGNCVGKLMMRMWAQCVLYYLMYQYIGRVGRPLPCWVRSLGRPRDNKKYIWCCLRGGDRTGTIYLFYFARVLHPAMVSLSFSCV
ncbi:hypothetical protein VPH35_029156 [Triticum aestivum]